MEPDEFIEMVKQLSQVKRTLKDDEVSNALMVSYAVKRFMRRKLETLIQDSPRDISMLVFMCDGWGASVSETIRDNFPGSHLTVTRKGRFRHEFLLQRAMFRSVDPSDITKIMHLLDDPIGLKLGKKAWNVFIANSEWLPTLRELGCKGITLSIYLADGALYSALERKYRVRHYLLYKGCAFGEEFNWVYQNLDWVICIKCVNHGCSNGCHWGLKTVGDKTVVDSCHICTASLINGSTALYGKIPDFVFRRLSFRKSISKVEDREQFWKLLGAEPELLDECVLMDIEWDGVSLDDLAHDSVEGFSVLSTAPPDFFLRCSLFPTLPKLNNNSF